MVQNSNSFFTNRSIPLKQSQQTQQPKQISQGIPFYQQNNQTQMQTHGSSLFPSNDSYIEFRAQQASTSTKKPQTSPTKSDNLEGQSLDGSSSGSEDENDNLGETKKSKSNSYIMKNGKRSFPCVKCNKEFLRGKHRRKHYIQVHPELNRYKCPVCSQSKFK